ncbi:MAG: DNA alkylation repair protein [Puia sp.]
MTVKQIMAELESMGSENIRKIFLDHGIREPLFGVKIENLKIIQKKVKTDYVLAKELYATGNADAMYLAGLIADDEKMTAADLGSWVKQAVSQNISEYTVPWVAAGSRQGYQLALEWIDAKEEHIAAAGWATLSMLVALKNDQELDLVHLKLLLQRVVKNVSKADHRVRHAMNGFVIAAGTHVLSLYDDAMTTAKAIANLLGKQNGKSFKMPDAGSYLLKANEKGLGKKKKTVKC